MYYYVYLCRIYNVFVLYVHTMYIGARVLRPLLVINYLVYIYIGTLRYKHYRLNLIFILYACMMIEVHTKHPSTHLILKWIPLKSISILNKSKFDDLQDRYLVV